MSAGAPLRPLTALMRRESRGARGRLVFMTACLAIGVAAVTGVAALVSAVEGAVRRDARALLAADVVVESRRPIPAEIEALVAPGAGAVSRAAQVTELGAMVRRDGGAGAGMRSRAASRARSRSARRRASSRAAAPGSRELESLGSAAARRRASRASSSLHRPRQASHVARCAW